MLVVVEVGVWRWGWEVGVGGGGGGGVREELETGARRGSGEGGGKRGGYDCYSGKVTQASVYDIFLPRVPENQA